MSTAARSEPPRPLPGQHPVRRRPGRRRAFRSLRHPEFRVVWGTFFIGNLGFWIGFISLQALMSRLTDGDGSWQGVLFFVNFIPMLVFAPVAGVIADRVERRRILMVGHAGIAMIATCLALLTLSGHATPAALLPFAFGIGLAFAFTVPTGQALVANAVPATDLSSAISLQSAAANFARVVGPTLAAPAIVLFDEGGAFTLYALASVVVALQLRRLHLPQHRRDDRRRGFWSSLREGVTHSRARPPAVTILSMLAVSSLSAGAYLAFLPVVAKEVYGRDTTGFTVLAAVSGLGAMLGALTTGMRERPPSLPAVALLVSGFGISLAAFARMEWWPAGLVAIAAVGVMAFAAMTSLNTLLQHLSDDSKRGRVMALFTIGWGGLVPVGGLWQAALADTWGVAATLTVAGCVTAAYPPVALLARRLRRAATSA